jgi:energy-coupling factor transporter transmembrane protein EcfT
MSTKKLQHRIRIALTSFGLGIALSTSAAPANADGALQKTIRQHEEGWQSNHAMKTLIDDYTREHFVVAAVGGVFAVGFAVVSVLLWKRYRKTPQAAGLKSTLARKMYFRSLLLSSVVGLSLGLLVFANASTALDPAPGFFMANTATTPNSQAVDTALNDWITSGNTTMPAILEKHVNKRVGWQRPKAIVSGFLFALFAALSVRISKALIRSSTSKSQWAARRVGLLAGKLTVVPLALLTMVMFIANTAGAMAPISISLLGGS